MKDPQNPHATSVRSDAGCGRAAGLPAGRGQRPRAEGPEDAERSVGTGASHPHPTPDKRAASCHRDDCNPTPRLQTPLPAHGAQKRRITARPRGLRGGRALRGGPGALSLRCLTRRETHPFRGPGSEAGPPSAPRRAGPSPSARGSRDCPRAVSLRAPASVFLSLPGTLQVGARRKDRTHARARPSVAAGKGGASVRSSRRRRRTAACQPPGAASRNRYDCRKRSGRFLYQRFDSWRKEVLSDQRQSVCGW
ncbi:profilin-2 isoform X1 [Myotis myotis]|uniref:profilin-2 isoform X1 n=1 Tax=Myotis myotis TaxID=51298 RepID=UPI00174E7950|nr:profilin-2 isoform X1 [Myotis myotis]